MSTATDIKRSATRRSKRLSRAFNRTIPLLPSVLIFMLFMLGPIVYSFWGSLTNSELSGIRAIEPQFVGLQNYQDLFTDPELYKSIFVTVVFVIGSALIGQNGLGLLLALMQQKAYGWVKTLVSTAIVTAWVLPEIVAAFAMYAYFSDLGTLNAMATYLGNEPVSWLYEHAVFSIVVANVWRGTAFSLLIYSAALGEVSPDILEAAIVDGANEWQKTIQITIPIIRRSIATNMMLVTLQTMGVFTIIWVMTAGGPGITTTTLPILAYQEAFKQSMVGMGTAISTILLVLGALMSFIYIKMLNMGGGD